MYGEGLGNCVAGMTTLADPALGAYRSGELDEAQALGEQALDLDAADRAGDAGALAQSCNGLGVGAAHWGDPVRAKSLLRRSLETGRQLEDPGASVTALNSLSRLMAEEGHPELALEAASEALHLGSDRADQRRAAALHTNLAGLLEASGRRPEALEHVKEAARRFASSIRKGRNVRRSGPWSSGRYPSSAPRDKLGSGWPGHKRRGATRE
jgi:tetratricopeptide (TPR) repeat protein